MTGMNLQGTPNRNILTGGTGNDALDGLGGNDLLRGGAGVDSIYGGTGADQLEGGGGGDLIYGDSDAAAFGGPGEPAVGGAPAGEVDGAGDDVIFAGGGNDTVFAEGGDDFVDGATGHDVLDGGAGDDLVIGGAGNDTIAGGAGLDQAVYFTNVQGPAAFAITAVGSTGWQVVATAVSAGDTSEGTDQLTGVEVVVNSYTGARTLLVGNGGFASLQAAIDAAGDGDTILVAAGTYLEAANYNASNNTNSGTNPLGLLINKSVTIQGLEADGTVPEGLGEIAVTVQSTAERMGGTNFLVTAPDVTIRGIAFQATGIGTDPVNKAFEVVANNFVFEGNTVGTVDGRLIEISIYFNDEIVPAGTGDGSGPPRFVSTIEDYRVDGNRLTGDIHVANGTGLNTDPAKRQMVITDNVFVAQTGEISWGIGLNGFQPHVGWRNAGIVAPTDISGNEFQAGMGKLLYGADQVAANNVITLDLVEDFIANNTIDQYAYITVADGSALRYAEFGSGPSQRFYTELGAFAGVVSELGQATDVLVVMSGSGPDNETIAVSGLTVKALAGSADLNLTLGAGVEEITLADYAAGLGAAVDVTGNTLANTIAGNSGANRLDGADGDDVLTGGAGNDSLVGGTGVDEAAYNGAIEVADLDADGTTWTVGAGAEGTDTLSGVEVVADSGTGRILLVGSGGFATIQAAVDAAEEGDTILIADGVYQEQVLIETNRLTLVGMSEGGTIIRSPASPVTFGNVHTGWGTEVAGVVTVLEASGVTITNLTVDGDERSADAAANGADDFFGILFLRSSGAVDDVTVLDVRDAVHGGMQRGEAIGFLNDYDPAALKSFSLSDSTLTGWQKTGVLVYNAVLTVTGNTITGAGPQGVIGQNGMQLSRGTQGSVSGNTITGIGYTTVDVYDGAGILVTDALDDLSITGNTISGVGAAHDMGVALYDSQNVTVSGNTISDFSFGAVDFDDPTWQAELIEPNNDIYTNTFTNVGTATLFQADPASVVNFSVAGSNGRDSLGSGAGMDTLDGGAGDDSLVGGLDNDSLVGGADNDSFDGGAGDDRIVGGTGTDTAIFSNTTTFLRNFNGSISATGPDGTDVLVDVETALITVDSVTVDLTAIALPDVTIAVTTDTGSDDTPDVTSNATVNGTGRPSTVVVVSWTVGSVTVTRTVTADADGNWSASLLSPGDLPQGAVSVTATQTDGVGGTDSATTSFVYDTAIAQPTIDLAATSDTLITTDNITREATPTLTGTAEAGSTVEIFDDATLLGTTTAGAGGAWSFTPAAPLSDADYNLTARATDAAGNFSTSGPLGVTIDTVRPAAPSLALVTDNGVSTTDNVTNSGLSVNVVGEPNASVSLALQPTNVIFVPLLSGAGTATVAIFGLGDGTYTYTLTVADAAGNVSLATTLTVTLDTRQPALTSIVFTDTALKAGETSLVTFTFSEAVFGLDLTDFVPTNGTLTALAGSGASWTATFTPDANFTGVGNVALGAGVTDLAGNPLSGNNQNVTIDTATPAAPTLTLVSDSGVPGDGITNAAPVIISVSGEEGSTAELSLGMVSQGTAVVTGGTATFSLAGLGEGLASFTATVTDTSGNTSLASAALNITVDRTPPAAPVIETVALNSVSGSQPTVTGTAEAGTTVTLFAGGTAVGSAVAIGGVWSITSTVLSGAQGLTARASDAAANPSDASNRVDIAVGGSGGLLSAEPAVVTLFGHDGADTLSGAATLNGGLGNDVLLAGTGAQAFIGSDGTDTVAYSADTAGVAVFLDLTGANGGEAAGDSLSGIENVTGGSGNDVLYGDVNANRLVGGIGLDTLDGGGGNDTLAGGAGADVLDGNAGTDVIDYNTSAAGVAINLAAGTASGGDAAGDAFFNFEGVFGSGFNDTLTGTALADLLLGNDGDDLIEGGAGSDTLNGGDGTDTLSYTNATGAGVNVNLATNGVSGGQGSGDVISNFENVIGSDANDTLVGTELANRLVGGGGSDVLSGGGGNDTLRGGAGDDVMNAGMGIDTADFGDATGNLVVNLATGAATGQGTDTLTDFENAIGGSGNDLLIGSGAINLLNGGIGDDTLRGGDGQDVLNGGAGFDIADYSDATAQLIITMGPGGIATSGPDTWTGIEGVLGGAGADDLNGNSADNLLLGGGGNDTLSGLQGNDTLDGGAGINRFAGGAGLDVIRISAIHGSIATNQSLINGFSQGGSSADIIDVSLIDPTGPGSSFAWIGTGAFTGGAQARYEVSGTNTVVLFEVGNGGAADLRVTIAGTFILASTDFLL